MFKDRHSAGEQLANELLAYRNQPGVLVLGIPRGGVATGSVVARQLSLPFGALVVRKLGYPGNPEFAMGAVDADGEYVLSDEFIEEGIVQTTIFQQVLQAELAEVRRRMQLFNPAQVTMANQMIILVDDGIATGETALAAVRYLERHAAREIIVAAPVASPEAVALLRRAGVRVVVLTTPANFMAVGQFYEDFPQLTDEEVLAIINLSNRNHQKDGKSN